LEDSQVDAKMRVSESAYLDFKDPVVARIARRARMFQGWRGNTTRIEPVLVQRYNVDGFYNYHFDWDEALSEGNRATTFMSYLAANCTGGGTNFPFLPQPSDERWCDVIECDEEGRDGYQGVIFKPILRSAVFWENFYPNGTGHKGVYHAGLPITSGTKVGLNIWSWDSAWVKPE
jgi:prolyl 4-hydroxylase